jgi:hypothetical protein
MVCHTVVDDTLADDRALLFAVEGRRVVLIVDDDKPGSSVAKTFLALPS